MPSHIHLILFIDGNLLADLMRDFKKFTAQKSLCELCGTNRIWQDRYDRQVITTLDIFRIKIDYIYFNPVKAGLVKNPQDWKWSSVGDYLENRNGPIEVWKDWY